MRKLVSFRTVADIKPIEGADFIEIVQIDGWQCVSKKGEFKQGDVGAYYEVDSFLPMKECYEFLRKTSYKKMGDLEGFRLKTVRLRGEISQGLLLPLSVAGLTGNEDPDRLAEMLGVVKYEPPIPAQLAGVAKGFFPSFIPKTDQERAQNLTEKIWGPDAPHRTFEISEKLDGSSTTYYWKDGDFGVCSRNLELLETEDNTLWNVANRYGLKNKHLDANIALQGEMAGEGIQGNLYKLKGQEYFIFDIWDIDKHEYFSPQRREDFLKENFPDMKTVPILERRCHIPPELDAVLKMAEGASALNSKTMREGLVFKEEENTSLSRFSFKSISNKYLLNQKD